MLKCTRIGVFGALMPLVMTGSVGAAILPFSDTFDWNTNAGPPTYTNFSDTALPTWSHSIAFSPSAVSIVTAFLDIRAQGNGSATPCNNSGELWFAENTSSTFIGNLSCSTGGTGFITDTFPIPISLFPALPASGWTLSLRLNENTTGTDGIALDYATLRGTYDTTAVPEPATLALLGLGIAGLGFSRRRS